MTPPERHYEAILRVAHLARLDARTLAECIERGLLPECGADWEHDAYIVACRVRRLTALGVNIQGVEIALHMRRRLTELHSELEALRTELESVRQHHDRELARLAREAHRQDQPDR